MAKTDSFLGTGWSFPPTFKRTSYSVSMVADQEDIQQSLRILLATAPGERFLQPTFGCDLHKFLFSPVDAGLKTYLLDLIKTAILYHEPRIVLDDITLSEEPNEGLMTIELTYTVRATNTRSNLVLPFYRDEGTDAAP